MCRNILLFLSILLLSVTILYAASDLDSISFATYYPSPYGSYHELHTDGLSIGLGNRTQAPPTDGLIVEGNVGIGIINPGAYGGKQTKADIAGNLAANDIWLKDTNTWLSNGIVSVGTWSGWCLSQQGMPNLCWGAHAPATCTFECGCQSGYTKFGVNATTPMLGAIDLIYVCVKD